MQSKVQIVTDVRRMSMQSKVQIMTDVRRKPVTVIFGPTASGKTDLAVELTAELSVELARAPAGQRSVAATETGSEDAPGSASAPQSVAASTIIVSFDSRQVYQGMTIVTGQDQPDQQFPVHGYGLIQPDQPWSVAHWWQWYGEVINRPPSQRPHLILVGGTWPYAAALWDPPASLGVPINQVARQEWARWSLGKLQSELEKRDPDRWQHMNTADHQNRRRLIRALEVATYVAQSGERPVVQPWLTLEEVNIIILDPELSALESRIKARVANRLRAGALDETRQLMRQYPDWQMPAFSATGYSVLRQHLEGKLSLAEVEPRWYQQERDYAKRQLTWVRKIKKSHLYHDKLSLCQTN